MTTIIRLLCNSCGRVSAAYTTDRPVEEIRAELVAHGDWSHAQGTGDDFCAECVQVRALKRATATAPEKP